MRNAQGKLDPVDRFVEKKARSIRGIFMTTLIALVEDIETAMNEYTTGWRNENALRVIDRAIQKIRFQSSMLEGYFLLLDGGRQFPFDHGYVCEKLSSLTGELDRFYSSRKHAMAGGVDIVKRQAMGDCSLLRKYFEKPWRQNANDDTATRDQRVPRN